MEIISPDLLAILVCPETHQRLSVAPPELLARLTALQAEGKLLNRAGQSVTEPLQGALVREDGQVAYPVFEGIPVMLVDEGIVLGE